MTRSALTLALAAVMAASMWCYADFILVPYEVADAARNGRPRGNLSDLYPRWWGAHELLLHGRDPYSAEVTREIQTGYYGRPLDSARRTDPKDQQGFAYPIFVVLLLAPTVKLSFATVALLFRWLLVLLIVGSVALWLAALGWLISTEAVLVASLLVLGSFPAVQAIKLEQLTALVSFLLAGCAAALVMRRLALAGFLLALATIKPQLAMPLAVWLTVWAIGDFRSRQRFLWSFLATLATLVAAGEILLPGWIGRFRTALRAYLEYAGGTSLFDLALGPTGGRAMAIVVIVAVGVWCWRWRRVRADSEIFGWTLSIVLTAILSVIPTFAPYNQLLLIPALVLIFQRGLRRTKAKPLARLTLSFVVLAIGLPWLATLGLDGALLVLPQAVVERAWSVPLWTSWFIPFSVLAALVVCVLEVKKEPTTSLPRQTQPVALLAIL
ncbi:MAG: DUF2029 domain-containing protein [Acidobacteria bacterium]|nr:DUF2029 domain-containing protein [Acidobacteriota bacterium]MBV9480170.1 DUF2029 domain-containing protein [Acidobacteriota bacterium]